MFDSEQQEPGLVGRLGVLLGELRELAKTDLSDCCPDELADAAVMAHQAQTMIEAQTARIDRAFGSSGRWRADSYRSAKAWLADRTGADPRSCGRSLRAGRATTELPIAAAAWQAGEITTDHLRRLAAARNPRTTAQLTADEHQLVDYAKVLGYADFDRLVTYWTQHVDPDGADQDAAAQRDARNVWITQSVSGMFLGKIALDPLTGAVVAAELDRLEQQLFATDWAAARQRLGREPSVDDLERTTAQRRADALTEMARRSAAMPPDATQPRILLSVLVGEGTFAQLCEIEATRQPIPPHTLAQHLGDRIDHVTFERILFDGPDRVISLSHRRLFTGALRRAIQTRDRHCQGPGCHTPALHCHIDHANPNHTGGPTTQTNGQAL